jgi:hypothetical protein
MCSFFVLVTAIATIDFKKLKEAGFKGIIFDKDNTLTAPYKLSVYPGIEVRDSQSFGLPAKWNVMRADALIMGCYWSHRNT